MKAPLPINESKRIAALRDYGILDTPEEPGFDEITALAAGICKTPIALISLVDETRQWFKSKVGVSIAETSRDVSFCAHAIIGNEILIVPDALEDPRFAQNPLFAGDSKIRFYAGAPLVSEDGLNLGALCVFDHEPRTLTEVQQHALLVLSRQVVAQMKLRRELRALQASEAERISTTETQATILDALPGHIALIDSAGVIIAVNESWRHLADANGPHAREVSVGDNYISVCESGSGPASEKAVAVADGLRKLLAGGITGFEIEYPCHSPGEQRWFRMAVTPLREGQRAGAVVMHVNITKRKQAELRLERLNRLYQVLSGINEMIVRVTDPGELLDEACRIAARRGQFRVAAVFSCDATGVSPDILAHAGPEDGCFAEVIATMPPEILCAGSINIAASTGRYVVSNDLSNDPQLPLLREAADRCGFRSVAAFPLKRQNSVFGVIAFYAGEAGYFQADEIKLLAGIAEDISYAADALQNENQRIETEAALRASEQRFRQLAEHFHGVFWMMDPATRQILYINPTYEKIWGRTCESLYASPQDWMDAVHPEDRETVNQAFASHPSVDFNQVYRIFHTDGSLRWIHARSYPVRNEQGEIHRIIGTAEDITERKTLELQFLRAQRMESIGTLAGGIAHDLNNVLAPIMMSIDILKQSITDPRSLEILELIGTSARRGADMVGQVLSFARGMEGRRIRLEIQTLIMDAVKIAEDTFPKNIIIRSEIDAQLWPLDADSTQIHQVLINLCVNARDAMPGGGNVIIRASNTAIDAHYAAMNIEARVGKHLCIEVEDNGTGMTRETIENIFDPFYTTKDIGAGTGLGLSTALAIVKSHGGFIRVYSDPGTGSRFRIYLPAAEVTVDKTVIETTPILPRGQGETVLVVDDEPSIRQITSQTLEAYGYSVLVAADGAEAVSTFVEYREHIAVVITDMMMPIMDGPSLIKILRRLDPAVRIIGTSGIASDDRVARSRQAGVSHFLAKPYTAETLLVTIRASLDEAPRS